jgi:hypothetical protein
LSREAALNGLVAREDIATMLRKLSQARDARVLARAGEWAIENEGAPADTVEVPVRHQPRKATLGPATRLDEGEVAAQVRALYEFSNGGSLFVPTQHQPMEPGLELIPDGLWEAQREHVMTWVSMGMAEDEVPAWARSVIPFAALPGDAGRWVVVTEGPHAGAVMMAAGDIHEEHVRYRSLAHFIAALRLFPQEILGCGGYVRYTAPGSELALFPEGYREDE